ncbi:MAG: hypothetical protein LBK13_04625 [Spirochaetales bacterium]|nr:hypothetical protein [Spirochaetales bacterium]
MKKKITAKSKKSKKAGEKRHDLGMNHAFQISSAKREKSVGQPVGDRDVHYTTLRYAFGGKPRNFGPKLRSPELYVWFYGLMLGAARRKGLERKAHRMCLGKSEDLERKARLLALCAKNALKF